MKVSIDKIVEGLEFCIDDNEYYYHTVTNDTFFTSSYGNSYDADNMSEEEIEMMFDVSIPLPSQREINEYSMMEEFAENIEDEQKQYVLNGALNGTGAFRRFKGCIYDLDLENDWFKFRDKKYKDIAINWCQDNDLDYIDDYEIKE